MQQQPYQTLTEALTEHSSHSQSSACPSWALKMLREVWENPAEDLVSISQLPVCRLWPLCLPTGIELSRENDLMKQKQGRNSCTALLPVWLRQPSPALIYLWHETAQPSQGLSLQLRVVPHVLLVHIMPQFPAEMVPAWIWDKSQACCMAGTCLCFTLGGLEVSKQAGLTPSTFLLPLCAQRVGLMSQHGRKGAGPADRLTGSRGHCPAESHRTDWCCKARGLRSIKDIMLKGH